MKETLWTLVIPGFGIGSPYTWYEQIYRFREVGYSVDYFLDFSVTTDMKNSSWRVLDLDQPFFGMSREYLVRGLQDPDVQVRKDVELFTLYKLG